MTVAEDKTYEYIRHHFRNFYHIHVLEILPYLSCLTASDQDLLRAHYNLKGNRNTIWELFNSLQRRNGWVESLIRALRACELTSLADEVAHVYQSNLPLNQRCPPASSEPPSASAEAPGPSRPAVASSASQDSSRDEESSYPMPVQDTQSPASLGESSRKGPQTPSPGTVPSRPSGPQEPSSDTAALSPQQEGSSGPREQNTELGSTHTEVLPPAGTVSSLPSPPGPVSPTVSFQPLARSTPRASRLPGPAVSALSAATSSSSSVGGAGGQAEATIGSSGVGVPTNSATASRAPSKVPTHSAFTSTVPSNSPTCSKPPTNVPTSPPPSKLPINTTRAGTVPPKVPAGLVPDHRMPTSLVPSKVTANKAPPIRSSNRPEEETPVSPAPTGAPAGGSSPCADRSSDSWDSGPELSKPGRLSSQDSRPFSGCSEDLAISCDSSGPKPNNAPEENEYSSVNGLSIHVAEGPSADLMAGNPGLHAAPLHKAKEEEEETQLAGTPVPWAPWLRVAAAGALLAALLAVLYRRRLLQ